MASADFSASSFRRYRRPWPFRADGEISRNKTHFFRPAGCGFTTLLRLGLGLRLVLQTCPQVGLVSAFCAYPPNFASDFLHPRPRGRKLVLGYLVPPNWPIGDFHSRPCVMSCVQQTAALIWARQFVNQNSPLKSERKICYNTDIEAKAQAGVFHVAEKFPLLAGSNPRLHYLLKWPKR